MDSSMSQSVVTIVSTNRSPPVNKSLILDEDEFDDDEINEQQYRLYSFHNRKYTRKFLKSVFPSGFGTHRVRKGDDIQRNPYEQKVLQEALKKRLNKQAAQANSTHPKPSELSLAGESDGSHFGSTKSIQDQNIKDSKGNKLTSFHQVFQGGQHLMDDSTVDTFLLSEGGDDKRRGGDDFADVAGPYFYEAGQQQQPQRVETLVPQPIMRDRQPSYDSVTSKEFEQRMNELDQDIERENISRGTSLEAQNAINGTPVEDAQAQKYAMAIDFLQKASLSDESRLSQDVSLSSPLQSQRPSTTQVYANQLSYSLTPNLTPMGADGFQPPDLGQQLTTREVILNRRPNYISQMKDLMKRSRRPGLAEHAPYLPPAVLPAMTNFKTMQAVAAEAALKGPLGTSPSSPSLRGPGEGLSGNSSRSFVSNHSLADHFFDTINTEMTGGHSMGSGIGAHGTSGPGAMTEQWPRRGQSPTFVKRNNGRSPSPPRDINKPKEPKEQLQANESATNTNASVGAPSQPILSAKSGDTHDTNAIQSFQAGADQLLSYDKWVSDNKDLNMSITITRGDSVPCLEDDQSIASIKSLTKGGNQDTTLKTKKTPASHVGVQQYLDANLRNLRGGFRDMLGEASILVELYSFLQYMEALTLKDAIAQHRFAISSNITLGMLQRLITDTVINAGTGGPFRGTMHGFNTNEAVNIFAYNKLKNAWERIEDDGALQMMVLQSISTATTPTPMLQLMYSFDLTEELEEAYQKNTRTTMDDLKQFTPRSAIDTSRRSVNSAHTQGTVVSFQDYDDLSPLSTARSPKKNGRMSPGQRRYKGSNAEGIVRRSGGHRSPNSDKRPTSTPGNFTHMANLGEYGPLMGPDGSSPYEARNMETSSRGSRGSRGMGGEVMEDILDMSRSIGMVSLPPPRSKLSRSASKVFDDQYTSHSKRDEANVYTNTEPLSYTTAIDVTQLNKIGKPPKPSYGGSTLGSPSPANVHNSMKRMSQSYASNAKSKGSTRNLNSRHEMKTKALRDMGVGTLMGPSLSQQNFAASRRIPHATSIPSGPLMSMSRDKQQFMADQLSSRLLQTQWNTTA